MCDPVSIVGAFVSIAGQKISADRAESKANEQRRKQEELIRKQKEEDIAAKQEDERKERLAVSDPGKRKKSRRQKAKGISALQVNKSNSSAQGVNIPRA